MFNRKDASSAQTFEVGVSFQFVELDPAEVNPESPVKRVVLARTPDLFYPFTSSHASSLGNLIAFATLSLAL